MENLVRSVSESSYLPSPSQYGFMELLGLQDFNPYSLLLDDTLLQFPPNPMDQSPEAPNQPATPNASSSISSASSEAAVIVAEEEEGEGEEGGEEEEDEDDEGEVQEEEKEDQQKQEGEQNAKKQVRAKKTNQKRQREPRFAFMTKSEVDHLEDGYRWRKYGQKAVKNSPFPRSYYRCTTASCNVKKRVERSCTDPTIVMTTYEGQHTHPSPLLVPRSALIRGPQLEPGFLGRGGGTMFSGEQLMLQRASSIHSQFLNYSYNQRCSSANTMSNSLSMLRSDQSTDAFMDETVMRKRRLCGPVPGVAGFVGGHGLLQDVVPSHVLKEE